MTRQSRRTWSIVLAFGLLVAPHGDALAGHGAPAMITDQGVFERDIGAHLPAGSARARVEAFLDARRVPYTYDAAARVITGSVVDLSRSWVSTRKRAVTFRFDGEERLLSWAVAEAGKQP